MIFRYPGGKSRLIPAIDAVLQNYLFDGDAFHDVFVGGGSVLMHVARTWPHSPLRANDLDPWMYSFWLTLVGDNAEFEELARLVSRQPTMELFKSLRETEAGGHVDRAYRAVFFNRTTFSGMAGSGPIGGYGQTSQWRIDCRYNADRLVREMRDWRHILLGRLEVYSLDGAWYASDTRECMYLDPPYYRQGPALYETHMTGAGHIRLAQVLHKTGRWVLSYDDCEEVRELYGWATITDIPARYSIRGKKYSWRESVEVIITPSAVVAPWQPELL